MLELENFEISEMHRFEKHFEFEDWCTRMHLTNDEIENLTDIMVNANEDVKRKFRIEEQDNQIESFQGEAVLLSAVKR